MNAVFAVGIVPQVTALFKSAILAAIVVVLSALNGAIAVPAGIATGLSYQAASSRRKRFLVGAAVAAGVFLLLWIVEVTVLLLLINAYLVT